MKPINISYELIALIKTGQEQESLELLDNYQQIIWGRVVFLTILASTLLLPYTLYKCLYRDIPFLKHLASLGTIRPNLTLNSYSDEMLTPLFLASKAGMTELVIRLVELGADIHQANVPVNSALGLGIISRSEYEKEKTLVPDLWLINSKALHAAAYYDRHETVRALLALKATAGGRNFYQQTPLHLCLCSPLDVSTETTLELIKAFDKKTPYGETQDLFSLIDINSESPLNLAAKRNKHQELFQMLNLCPPNRLAMEAKLKLCHEQTNPVHDAIQTQSIDALGELLTFTDLVDPNLMTSRREFTPLHYIRDLIHEAKGKPEMATSLKTLKGMENLTKIFQGKDLANVKKHKCTRLPTTS